MFAADLQELRGQDGQIVAAANLRALLDGSPIVASHRGPEDTRVQDAYSLRCAPAVAGAARDTLAHARLIATRELGAVIDNPVITVDGRLESNGNFHGAPVAYVLDFLAIADRGPRGHVRAPHGPLPGHRLEATGCHRFWHTIPESIQV